jgi:hypothetical protein
MMHKLLPTSSTKVLQERERPVVRLRCKLIPEIPHDMYGKWKTTLKGGNFQEREEMSETESTIKPPEADPGTRSAQSGSQQSKVIAKRVEES